MAIRTFLIDFGTDSAVGLTLTFDNFRLLTAGTEIYPRPTITELGDGFYSFEYDPYTQNDDILWAVSDATNTYFSEDRILRQAFDNQITLDFNNQNATGLTLTFTTFKKADSNVVLTTEELFKCTDQYLAAGSAPAITEVGFGIYRAEFRNLLDENVYFVAKDSTGAYRLSGIIYVDELVCQTPGGVSLVYLRDRVRAETNYPNEDHYTDTRLNGWINDALAEFVTKTKWLTGSKTFTSTFTNGISSFDMDSEDRFATPITMRLISSNGYNQRPAKQIGRREYERLLYESNNFWPDRPTYFIDYTTPITPTVFIFKGRWNNVDVTGGTFYFNKRMSCLTFDNDECEIPIDYASAIIAWVNSRIYSEEDDKSESVRQYKIFMSKVNDALMEVDARNDNMEQFIDDVFEDELDHPIESDYAYY